MEENNVQKKGYSIKITLKNFVITLLILGAIIAVVVSFTYGVARIENLDEKVAKVDSVNQLQEGDLDQTNKTFTLMDSTFSNLEKSVGGLDTTQKEVFTSFASFKDDYTTFKSICASKFARIDKLEKKIAILEATVNEQGSNYQAIKEKVSRVDTLEVNYNRFITPTVKTDTIPSDTIKVDVKKKKQNRFGIPRRKIKIETDGSKMGW